VSASEVSRLHREYEEQIKDLRAQAGKVLDLEAELAKAKDAESTLRQEFEQRLAKGKEELSTKYDAKVEKLRVAQDATNKERDAKVRELIDLRESDHEKHDAELDVWRGRDRKIHSVLQGLEDSLLGEFSLLLLRFYSSTLLPFLLAISVEAFPDSFDAAAAAVEKCRKKYNIDRAWDPKAELSSAELAASVKGRLQPVAALGLQLRTASVFKTLWPGWAEPDTVDWLLQWMTIVSNRVEV
jgi:ElaB/YqjD/DUF883 family membrane-anchored ribosome-binding protein